MRFGNKYSLEDREGEVRIRRKFLWWPRTFMKTGHGLKNETRWFERADVVEKICKVDVGGSMEWGNYAWKWCEVGFADTFPAIPQGVAYAASER